MQVNQQLKPKAELSHKGAHYTPSARRKKVQSAPQLCTGPHSDISSFTVCACAWSALLLPIAQPRARARKRALPKQESAQRASAARKTMIYDEPIVPHPRHRGSCAQLFSRGDLRDVDALSRRWAKSSAYKTVFGQCLCDVGAAAAARAGFRRVRIPLWARWWAVELRWIVGYFGNVWSSSDWRDNESYFVGQCTSWLSSKRNIVVKVIFLGCHRAINYFCFNTGNKNLQYLNLDTMHLYITLLNTSMRIRSFFIAMWALYFWYYLIWLFKQ